MAIIAQADVERHLIGITPYVNMMAPADVTALYAEAIAAAQADIERRSRILCEPKRIMCNAAPPPLAATYDLLEDAYTLHKTNTNRPIRFHARHRPIISVQHVVLGFGPVTPIIDFPTNWLRINWRLGVVTIIPYMTGIAPMSSSGLGMYMSIAGAMAWPVDAIPQFLWFSYTAGVADASTDDWADLRRGLARRAALNVIQDVARLLPGQIGVDGFSQTLEAPERMIDRMEKEYELWLERFTSAERAVVVGVL